MIGFRAAEGVTKHRTDRVWRLGIVSRTLFLGSVGLLVALALVGCSGKSAVASPPVRSAPTTVPSPTASPTPMPTPAASPTPVAGFTPTGSMSVARDLYTATLLRDGRVLIAGGIKWTSEDSYAALASAEHWDPSTGEFTLTGSMKTARVGATATLLNDGKVLLAGGGLDKPLASTELYDPATGEFSPTGSMVTPRGGATATLLNDGRVLIAGGGGGTVHDPSTVSTAELYDPKIGSFSPTGSMTAVRVRATATLLKDGRVLIAGGAQISGSNGSNYVLLGSAELYDPKTGTFSQTGSMFNIVDGHTATLLADGRVLIDGGAIGAGGTLVYELADELYDPAAGRFIYGGERKAGRSNATATLLPDGRVLIVGGITRKIVGNQDTAVLDSAESYDPTTGEFTAAGSLVEARFGATATLLPDGRVLIVGGSDKYGVNKGNIASAEVYTP